MRPSPPSSPSPDVLVIGGGIAGCSTAYFLSRAGATVALVDRDGVAVHASGMSAGGLNPLEGDLIPGPLAEFAMRSYRLHLDLWEELAERTEVGFDERIVPWIRVAFSEDDLPALERSLDAFEGADGFSAKRLGPAEVLGLEPRISPDVVGGVYLYGNAAVDGRGLTLALMTAAERMGASFLRADVTAIRPAGGGSVDVTVGGESLAVGTVVVAAGPWSTHVLDLAGERAPVQPPPIGPLKGEILRLDPPGPMYRYDIGYPGGEAHPKQGGLVWVGATVEDVGFDEEPTDAARESLMADAVRAIPDLAHSRVAEQTACLRPVTPDGLPVIGRAPGHDDLYVVSGAGKKGILLGPAMGRALADLVTTGETDLPMTGFEPERLA